MDFRHQISGGSPTSSSSTSSSSHNPIHRNGTHNTTTTLTTTTTNTNTNTNTNNDPMQSWWESISKARSRIHLLSTLLPIPTPDPISSLADSDTPALSLLTSQTAYDAVSSSLSSSPFSGAGDDHLCNWLYDTFISSDPDLRLVVLSFIPLIAGIYLSRIHTVNAVNPSLAGFEAVLLALYSSETKSRAGKPVVVSIPDLSQPSLYHSPRGVAKGGGGSNTKISKKSSLTKVNPNSNSNSNSGSLMKQCVGILSQPLEPQTAIKSTKRATIVGVAFDCYYKYIAQMPSWSKLDFCKFAASFAGQDCNCKCEFDEKCGNENAITSFCDDGVDDDGVEIERNGDVVEGMKSLAIENGDTDKGTRILLPWELLQPMLRILGHCLLGPLNTNDVKDAASEGVRCLYARASHDLVPQAILATRSLIQLDKRAREAAVMAATSAVNTPGSNANTPSKAKKPEILLVSK